MKEVTLQEKLDRQVGNILITINSPAPADIKKELLKHQRDYLNEFLTKLIESVK